MPTSQSSSDAVARMLAQGIAALKAGNQAEAYALLQQVVQREPANEQAWLWLSGATNNADERRQCLEQVLAVNPANAAAQRGLALLGPRPPALPSIVAPPPAAEQTPDVAAPVAAPKPLVVPETIAVTRPDSLPKQALLPMPETLAMPEPVVAPKPAAPALSQSSNVDVATRLRASMQKSAAPRRDWLTIGLAVALGLILVAIAGMLFAVRARDQRAAQLLAVAATSQPSATVRPTVRPSATARPTVRPSATARPTSAPTATTQPTNAPATQITAEPTTLPGAGIVEAVIADSVAKIEHNQGIVGVVAALDAIIAKDQNNIEAHYQRGRAYARLFQIKQAFQEYALVISAQPNDSRPFVSRCVLEAATSHLDSAYADCDEAIRLDPHNPKAWGGRGLVRKRQGDIAGAIMDYSTAIQINPHFTEALVNRAELYMYSDNAQAAIQDMSAAIQEDPNNSHYYCERARYRINAMDSTGAIADGNDAIRTDPQSSCAYYTRGRAYDSAERRQEAIKDYNEAIRLQSGFVDAMINRGYDYLTLGNNQAALNDYNAAIALSPSYARAYAARGGYYQVTGNSSAARADYKYALELYSYLNDTQNATKMQELLDQLPQVRV